MEERIYVKSEVVEWQIKEAAQAWWGVVGVLPWALEDCNDKWRVVLDDRSVEVFDAALANILAFPNLMVPSSAEIVAVEPSKVGGDSVVYIGSKAAKSGARKAARVGAGVDVTKLKTGDKVTIVFEDADREKVVIVG